MAEATFLPLKPKVVLGVAAHADDLDFGASGTLAHFASQGAKVYYLIITDGSKGTERRDIAAPELIKIRQQEQRAAAKIIGAAGVEFLSYPDGALEVTIGLKRDLVRIIRRLKPEVLITMDPSMLYSADRGFINHPDHRAAGQAALDAVFPLARDHLAFPELDASGYAPHKVDTVLLTNFDKNDFCVDITATIDKKLAALAAHSSQISDLAAVQDQMKQLAARLGAKAGYAYGECFMRIDVQQT